MWSACQTAEEERDHRKLRLVVAFRVLASLEMDDGVAGHVTVRDPEHPGLFWVNPFGPPFARIRVRDLVSVDERGNLVEGVQPINPSAFAIHASIHRHRPDVQAAVHSHSRCGRAWSSLGRHLDPITQDHCDFFEDHGLYGTYEGRVLDPQEGDRIATALGGHKAVILQNHGLLTVGRSIEEATWWFIRMERCCEMQLLAEAAGRPRPIATEAARQAHAEQGHALAGWFSAQSLFDAVIEAEGDALW